MCTAMDCCDILQHCLEGTCRPETKARTRPSSPRSGEPPSPMRMKGNMIRRFAPHHLLSHPRAMMDRPSLVNSRQPLPVLPPHSLQNPTPLCIIRQRMPKCLLQPASSHRHTPLPVNRHAQGCSQVISTQAPTPNNLESILPDIRTITEKSLPNQEKTDTLGKSGAPDITQCFPANNNFSAIKPCTRAPTGSTNIFGKSFPF